MCSLTAVFGDEADILQETDFQVLLLATVTGPLGPALSSPLLDTLTSPYGVSGTRIGLLLSAYTAPAIVIIPLIGVLTDRYGRKPLLVAGLVLFGIAGTALSLTMRFASRSVYASSKGSVVPGSARSSSRASAISTAGVKKQRRKDSDSQRRDSHRLCFRSSPGRSSSLGGGVTGVLYVLVASQASTNSFAPVAG